MPTAQITSNAFEAARERIARASRLRALRESLGPAPAIEAPRPFESRHRPHDHSQRPAA
ncbi:MAG: hypothetical protein HY875_13445 [Chloroflexi bacterium]|nr:hypothetical protein [Chloroflexota bacterium]